MTPLQRFLVQAHDFAKTPSPKNGADLTEAMTRLQQSIYGPGVSASGLPLDASGSIVDVVVDAMRAAQDAQHGCGPVFADEARDAELPPGFSWFVRNPKTGLWFSDAKDAWVARDHATQFGTFEAAVNAIKVNGLRGAEVKSSQSVR